MEFGVLGVVCLETEIDFHLSCAVANALSLIPIDFVRSDIECPIASTSSATIEKFSHPYLNDPEDDGIVKRRRNNMRA